LEVDSSYMFGIDLFQFAGWQRKNDINLPYTFLL